MKLEKFFDRRTPKATWIDPDSQETVYSWFNSNEGSYVPNAPMDHTWLWNTIQCLAQEIEELRK